MCTVYGIPNCDTVKKAMNWLKEMKVDHRFYDYKKQGISVSKLQEWSKQVARENLLNKKSTTWKQMNKEAKSIITNPKTAIELMCEKTSVIKRPIIERDNKIVALSFDGEFYREAFIGK